MPKQQQQQCLCISSQNGINCKQSKSETSIDSNSLYKDDVLLLIILPNWRGIKLFKNTKKIKNDLTIGGDVGKLPTHRHKNTR